MKKNNFYKNKAVLVTGGAGSIGSDIVRELLKYGPKVIRVLDNNETGLFELEQELASDKLRFFIGDIRDKSRLVRAMDGTDIVFHAAALKHVPLCEYNPFEAVQTNVVGTQNVIDAALNSGVKKLINISTDKAVNPVSVMGASKLLTEKLIVASALYHKGINKTIFSSVRFGNVLNSRGSILPLFKRQIKNGSLLLTNPKMTRFIMSSQRAIELVLRAAEMAEGGEIFILKMPIVKMGDFASAAKDELAFRCGYDCRKIKIKIVGERKGEKTHEELMTKEESLKAMETEDMFVILPQKEKNQNDSHQKSYCSKEGPFLSAKEIKNLLEEAA